MSILIRGMEMPKSCQSCFANEYQVCIFKSENAAINGRLSGCPLVPVPPHGDLIDRKDAYDSLLDGMVMTGYQSRALDCISEFYVPTIIEAEEGET